MDPVVSLAARAESHVGSSNSNIPQTPAVEALNTGEIPSPTSPYFSAPVFRLNISQDDSKSSDNCNVAATSTVIDSDMLNQDTTTPRGPTRRPTLSQFFPRNGSFASLRSFTRAASFTSDVKTARDERPPSPAPSIIPDILTENLWDEIDSPALSIEYFKAMMKRFSKPERPEPQSCLDFSLLHFINIRHLEHLLYAELNWFNEAIEKDPHPEAIRVEGGNDYILHTIDEVENRYPHRLQSIQKLLHQYSHAVRDFEDMRKRPVKTSIEVSFKRAGEASARPRRPSAFLSKRGSSRSKSSSKFPEDEESANGSAFYKTVNQATMFTRAVHRLGRPIDLHKRQETRRLRLKLSHRSIAGVEDWKQDFKNHSHSIKEQHEEKRRQRIAAMRRFGMAVAGGVALIVPVIIMAYHQNTIGWSLVTTSVATFVFAIFMTVYSKADEKDIVLATAAYAAVLVVFIGASLTTPIPLAAVSTSADPA